VNVRGGAGMFRGLLRRAAAPLFLLCCTAAADSSPLPVREQNPLLAGFGGPGAMPARLSDADAWSLEAAFAWGNSAIMQTSARESLIVDAETREFRFIAQRAFPNGYALRIQVPYRHTSAGSLDGFIDRWHDTFGLPEGARPSLPQDELRLFYRRDGVVKVNSRSSAGGFGDVSVEIGRTLLSTSQNAISGWLALKLPSGDAEDFTGSSSLDMTAAIAADYQLAPRWRFFGQLAGTWMSEGDRLPAQQRDWSWSAMAGVSARTFGQLVLTLQLDARTAVYDTEELDYLGDAVVLSVAGSYDFASDWTLSLGVSEDIAVESAPDVVFLFDLKKTF